MLVSLLTVPRQKLLLVYLNLVKQKSYIYTDSEYRVCNYHCKRLEQIDGYAILYDQMLLTSIRIKALSSPFSSMGIEVGLYFYIPLSLRG